MDDIRQMTTLAALNKMFKQGHFSISIVREIAEMMEVVPGPEAMAILRPLHCVDYADMPRDLYAALPSIIERALTGSPLFQFELKREPDPLALQLEQPKPAGLVRRLLGGLHG